MSAQGTAPADSPYLAASLEIGRQLERDALRTSSGIAWETDELAGGDDDYAIVRTRTGADLYAGAAGIAWFLGHLAPYDSSGALAATAAKALSFAIADARKMLKSGAVSLLSGSTGVALAALEVADCLKLPGLRRSALSLAKESAEQASRAPSQERDLIGGTAGVVIGLLAIHRRTGNPLLLEACRSACDGLLNTARREWWGCSWPENGNPALCGLAHGMSGIAWALAETAWVTGDRRFLAAAQEALRYERSWFSPERCGWPDLREPGKPSAREGQWPGWMTAWCHGALGAGAVRLRWYEASGGDDTALAEASAAIQAGRLLVMQAGADMRNGQLSDTTLCHGLGGAAELFLLAHEVFQLEDHRRAARRVGDLCLDVYRQNSRQWTLGLRGAKRVPGLFLGVAGIGVTLLRLHDSSSIGSPILPGRPQPGEKRGQLK